MMQRIRRALGAIGAFFSSGQAARRAERALAIIAEVRPYIIRAADLAVSLTPTPADDVAWQAIRARYPRILIHEFRTPDEIKSDALIIATELIRARWPHLSTTVARLAAQQSYLDWQAADPPP